MTGPRWIKQWINNLAALNDLFRDDDGKVDFEALGREEYQFRQALVTHKFAKSERAKEAYQQAMTAYSANVANGKKGGRPKKSPQDAPNGNAGVDMSDTGNGAASKSPTSCDQFTADGDIREDSQAEPDGSASTRNVTRAHDALGPSANHYGDIRDDSRGRYAPPSCSPDDGKLYDQETDQVSTDEARQSRRAGENSVRVAKVSSPPVRNLPRNKEEVRLFAIDNGLDVDDANDWAEMNLRERHGRDKDGKPIRNWKGAILNYCKAMAAKRETA